MGWERESGRERERYVDDCRKYLLMYFWRNTATAARITNVTKSPNDDANGHAILSIERGKKYSLSDCQSTEQ
jgi:hypothetical protein